MSAKKSKAIRSSRTSLSSPKSSVTSPKLSTMESQLETTLALFRAEYKKWFSTFEKSCRVVSALCMWKTRLLKQNSTSDSESESLESSDDECNSDDLQKKIFSLFEKLQLLHDTMLCCASKMEKMTNRLDSLRLLVEGESNFTPVARLTQCSIIEIEDCCKQVTAMFNSEMNSKAVLLKNIAVTDSVEEMKFMKTAWRLNPHLEDDFIRHMINFLSNDDSSSTH